VECVLVASFPRVQSPSCGLGVPNEAREEDVKSTKVGSTEEYLRGKNARSRMIRSLSELCCLCSPMERSRGGR
jgi:hypothetical protein